jgi:uncharacterized protein
VTRTARSAQAVFLALVLEVGLGGGLGVRPAVAQVAVPALTGRVVDLTGTLSGAAVARIESKLAEFETKKGTQFAVLIVPTTEPEDIEQFGIRVADQWQLGRKGVDDGAILLVAKQDRRVRIEVGKGLEGALPDVIASRIVGDTITPLFKQGNFDGGVEAGVGRMIAVVNGEALPAPDKQWERPAPLGNLLPILLVGIVIVSGVLRSVLGRLGGSIATGLVAGGAVWLLTHLILVGLFAGLIGFALGLLFGAARGWAGGGGWGGGGWGGGFGGGSGGGSGGRGGFSGGGGGFSGGGASGGW